MQTDKLEIQLQIFVIYPINYKSETVELEIEYSVFEKMDTVLLSAMDAV
jgi:hypothetical protein